MRGSSHKLLRHSVNWQCRKATLHANEMKELKEQPLLGNAGERPKAQPLLELFLC